MFTINDLPSKEKSRSLIFEAKNFFRTFYPAEAGLGLEKLRNRIHLTGYALDGSDHKV